MNRSYNLIDAIRVLIKWKLPIALFVGAATLVSIVVALLLPNYYESKSVFFPTNPAVTDRQAMFSTTGGETAMDYFGTKNDVNRFITIANSSPLLDFMINNFKLAEHYDVDTTDADWRYKVKKELLGNYTVVKTEFGAIEITFMDRKPELAANAVNSVVEVIDKQNKALMVGNKEKVLEVFRTKKEQKEKELNTLTDSLAVLSERYGIVEMAPATEKGSAIVKGNDPRGVEQYKVLKSRHDNALLDLNTISTLYDQHEAASEESVSTVYIVEKAYPADRKSWPIRWLIVVSSALIALFFGIVGALLLDQMKGIKEQLNAQPADR